MTDSPAPNDGRRPALSLVMPCYNEENNVQYAISRLIKAFEESPHRVEIVAVDNGSRDRTGELIAQMAAEHPGTVIPATVETNVGFGFGLLTGIPHTSGHWVGFIAADGQVDAEDVVRLFDAAISVQGGNVVAKVRRRFRMDGPLRKVISISYNLFMWMLYPKLGSLDVNGTPRLLPRDMLMRMDIQSTNWLFDPELLIKAYYMDVRVLELNVFSRMRCGDVSHVRMGTCWEFFTNILKFRFGGTFKRWKKDLDAGRLEAPATTGAISAPVRPTTAARTG